MEAYRLNTISAPTNQTVCLPLVNAFERSSKYTRHTHTHTHTHAQLAEKTQEYQSWIALNLDNMRTRCIETVLAGGRYVLA